MTDKSESPACVETPKGHDDQKRRYVVVSDAGTILGPSGQPGLHLVFDTRAMAEGARDTRGAGVVVPVRLTRDEAALCPLPPDALAAAREVASTGRNFLAMVSGECPSLLEDDHNSEAFVAALDKIASALKAPSDV